MPDQTPPYSKAFDCHHLFRLRTNGRRSLILDFKKDPDPLVLIHQMTQYLLEQPPENLINIIPASLCITLVFSQDVQANSYWQDKLTAALSTSQSRSVNTRNHQLMVCYETGHKSAFTTDLHTVCDTLQCTTSQLIEAHSSVNYRVDMLGFLPGFAYLSGLPDALQLPRKSKPRLSVPAGSVAIAEQYSAIYPVDSPGGWHLVGHTHFKCIDWQSQNFCPFKPLDTVRFVPISFETWSAQNRGSS